MGQATVGVGGIGSSAIGAGPINGGAAFASTQERPIYSLWHVIVVDENLRLVTNRNQVARNSEGSDEDQRAYLNRMLRLRWRPCARKKKTGSCAGLSYVASTNERQLRVQSLVDKAVFKSSHCVQLQCIYRVWVSRYP